MGTGGLELVRSGRVGGQSEETANSPSPHTFEVVEFEYDEQSREIRRTTKTVPVGSDATR